MDVENIDGLVGLWTQTRGHEGIRICVIDGPADRSHPCLRKAHLTPSKLWPLPEQVDTGPMGLHGTHVTSILFGQDGISGISPLCRGYLIPLLPSRRRPVPQLDLARAIEEAVEEGCHIINVSAGQFSDSGAAEDWLLRAAELCHKNRVLLVAAAGNDGCDCLHVPASLPGCLAVGAMDAQGMPLDFSNWGERYRKNGLLAPGKDILGASPGQGTRRLSGTSFAAPIVSGIAALLLSLQLEQGVTPDPIMVGRALLDGAERCTLDSQTCLRWLVGKLSISGALQALQRLQQTPEAAIGPLALPELFLESVDKSEDQALNPPFRDSQAYALNPSLCDCDSQSQAINPSLCDSQLAGRPPESGLEPCEEPPSPPPVVETPPEPAHLAPPTRPSLVFAIGQLDLEFPNESREQEFGRRLGEDPHNLVRLLEYLENHPEQAPELTWIFSRQGRPAFVLQPAGDLPYAIYQRLVFLKSALEDTTHPLERISLPGVLTSATHQLRNGMRLPVVAVHQERGMYGWSDHSLVTSLDPEARRPELRAALLDFLGRVYGELDNPGILARDRALNFAATNLFQASQSLSEALAQNFELHDIEVKKSPFCRLQSECWDIVLKFQDPENCQRAFRVYRFTIDVSDSMPVTLGSIRAWASRN